MKFSIFTLLILFSISLNVYSQTEYEKGYFITNNGDKVEGLIKNKDWLNNPTEINFKLSTNAEVQTETIDNIQEFGIYDKSKYQRATVDIDKSSESFKKLDDDREPKFEEEQLLLKVLIEGKASLYSYEDTNYSKFFYKVDDSDIEQLVYKEYLQSQLELRENNYYKQQLLNNLKCRDLSLKQIENLEYSANKLIKLFIEYNECENADFRSYAENHEKTRFHLSLKAGVKNSSLEISNLATDSRDTDFGSQIGFRFGLEAEFILPFHNDKWGLLVEPMYQNFISTKETPGLKSEVTYHSVELPLGIRHYMFLNQSSKLFLNGMVVIDMSFESKFEFQREAISSLEIDPATDVAFGLGYKYNDRYSVELRYHIGRELLANYTAWNSNYSTVAVILGYTVF